jgi:hypothetical protein
MKQPVEHAPPRRTHGLTQVGGSQIVAEDRRGDELGLLTSRLLRVGGPALTRGSSTATAARRGSAGRAVGETDMPVLGSGTDLATRKNTSY